MNRPYTIPIVVLAAFALALYGADKNIPQVSESDIDAVNLNVVGKYATICLSHIRQREATTEPTTRPGEEIIFETSINSEKIEGVVQGNNINLRLFGSSQFPLGQRDPTYYNVRSTTRPTNIAVVALAAALKDTQAIAEVGEALATLPDSLLAAKLDNDIAIAKKANSLATFLTGAPRTFVVYTPSAAFDATLSTTDEWKKAVLNQGENTPQTRKK